MRPSAPTTRGLAATVSILAMLLAVAGVAHGQRGGLERRDFEDLSGGYRVNTPKDWEVVPVTPERRELGLAFQADAPKKGPEGGRFRLVLVPDLEAFDSWCELVISEVLYEGTELSDYKPEENETEEVHGLPTLHRRWLVQGVYLDTWYFERAGELDDIGLIGTVSDEDRYDKSWLVTFGRAAQGLEVFEPVDTTAGKHATYEERIAAAEAEAARTEGWRVVPTPSKKFILLTSSDNDRFVDEIIERLERSREVFEEDYPPPENFDHVSIVRLCGTEEEFHRYGRTGGGVAGWFNPSSTELVLYDAKMVDRNMSYAVMTHEAFHQYCHFLFGRSEAHRWFDEGHGDYYGGMQFNARGKPEITPRMPAGLDRLPGIRQMVRDGTYVPIEKHLNFDHPEWQSRGVASYMQSWSIVYMLRQGMIGKVPRKVWRDEYAKILPTYIEKLRDGFARAYAEERVKRAKEAGDDGTRTTAEVAELDSGDLGDKKVREIWTEAMDAAWGDVDLEQFEEDWALYVKKYLDG